MTDYQALLARYDAPARAAITPPPATLTQPAATPIGALSCPGQNSHGQT